MAPSQQFGNVAVDAFERIVRKNYAVVGDVVELSVRQAKVSASGKGPQQVIEQQSAGVREFAERANAHASDYQSLFREIGSALLRQTDSDLPASTARKATRSASRSAAAAVTETVEETAAVLDKASSKKVSSNQKPAVEASASATRKKVASKKAVSKKAVSKPIARTTVKAAEKPAAKRAASTGSRPAAKKRASSARQAQRG